MNITKAMTIKYFKNGTSAKGTGYNFISCEQNVKGSQYPQRCKVNVFGELLDLKTGDCIAITEVPTDIKNVTDKYTKDGVEKTITNLTLVVSPSAIKVVDAPVEEEQQAPVGATPIDDSDLPF